MKELSQINLKAPYLIFIGDISSHTYAKIGLGIVQWRKQLVPGKLRFLGNSIRD